MKKYNIYKRKDGRYEGRYNAFIDGVVVRKYFYGQTREDVETKIKSYIDSLIEDEKNTFRRFNSTITQMAEEFLEVRRSEIRANTFGQYQRDIYKHIIPVVGKYKIHELDNEVMDKFDKYLKDSSLAKRTQRDLKNLLNNIIAYSKMMFNIRIQEDVAEIRFLSTTDVLKLLDYVNSGEMTPSKLMIKIVLYTGIRNGELCGLRWSDIDLEAETIRVCRTIQRVLCGYNNEGTVTKVLTLPIKERVIPIPTQLLDTLKKYKELKNCYIITNSNKCIEPSALLYKLTKITQNMKIKTNISSLRHTYAVNCLNCGVNPKYLSEILGITPESLAKYIRICKPQEDIRRALEKLLY